jgi:uncharacterized iron-regulated protein
MFYIRTFVTVAFLTCSFSLFTQITSENYRIYSVKLAKEVTLNDIANDMANYDVLFFGEEHNDSVTHFLEKMMLETLFNVYGNKVALSMEMFDRDVQPVMNEYLTGYIREKNFTKDARVWSNYSDYKPMVEFAKTNQLNVICANTPTRYTNLAGRKGQQALMELPKESKKFFAPLPYDTASGKYYEKLVELTSHGAAVDSTGKPLPPVPYMTGFNLIMGQSLWDATMAYSISEYIKKHKGNKVMQVNGRFHSDEKFAIVTQLKNYSPKTKALVISAGSDDSFPNINWNDFTYLGDYIIITDPKVAKTYEE